jgi:hypothetical protein
MKAWLKDYWTNERLRKNLLMATNVATRPYVWVDEASNMDTGTCVVTVNGTVYRYHMTDWTGKWDHVALRMDEPHITITREWVRIAPDPEPEPKPPELTHWDRLEI